MIDFTGWACVNCRKMEEQVWTRDDIYSVITDDYILVSLYVDDRKKLDSDTPFLLDERLWLTRWKSFALPVTLKE